LDASSLSEAKDALARLRAEPTEQNRRKKSVALFPEFWPVYIEAVRHQKRERTIKTEEMFLRQWEAWLGPIPINRVTAPRKSLDLELSGSPGAKAAGRPILP
jgi:hypothetical protein